MMVCPVALVNCEVYVRPSDRVCCLLCVCERVSLHACKYGVTYSRLKILVYR
jgi:hypothetical protein